MNPETKICKQCQTRFEVTPGEQGLYEKIGIPIPGKCFKCRMQHLFAFWVFGKFRKGKSDLSGENLITVLPPNPRYPIYTSNEWFSDKWDPLEHGREYDPKRPFFEQFEEVQKKVPRPHRTGRNNLNCDWSTDVFDGKNIYLSRAVINNSENLSYCYRVSNCKDSLDLVYAFDTQMSYATTYVFDCYKLFYSFNCRSSLDSKFLFDCHNVQNCFMCWNLRNKQYHILNQPYSREEYTERLKTYNFGSRKVIAELTEKFWNLVRNEAVHRANFNINVKNSSGNYLTNSDNCHNCFYWEYSQDCWNCMRGIHNKSCVDSVGSESELSGSNAAAYPGIYGSKYSAWIANCRNMEYCELCFDCESFFGCVGLRKKRWCILNRQYTEEQYKNLRSQIVANMRKEGNYGEFFPYRLADGGYNLSTAQIFFPKSKEQTERMGAVWIDAGERSSDGIPPEELPDDIAKVESSITKQALVCPKTGYRFNIAPQELQFYKEFSIPLPFNHPDYRVLDKLKMLTVIDTYPYKCTFCGKDVQAYYPPEWGYKKIACVECYQKEVV